MMPQTALMIACKAVCEAQSSASHEGSLHSCREGMSIHHFSTCALLFTAPTLVIALSLFFYTTVRHSCCSRMHHAQRPPCSLCAAWLG